MGTVAEIGSFVVIGGGIGGLCAAIEAAAAGARVTLLERAEALGGKMRELTVAGRQIDSGPTVLTMRWAFEELFAGAGRSLQDYVDLVPLQVLARHGWPDGSRLDLFTDLEASSAAIASFANAREAEGYRRFCAHVERIHAIVEQPFLRSDRPTIRDVIARRGLRGMLQFASIDWHRSMWQALGEFFHDPRLRQLFGRYATYYGSSPFEAPATINLIAHVERLGVWRVVGGMSRLADALAELARELGVEIRTGCSVDELIVERGRCVGVRFAGGSLRADAVIVNAAPQALDAGLFGESTRGCVGLAAMPRSLSAVTWSMVARTRGFPLAHHSVFFSPDYPSEFAELERSWPPARPTVYVCAHDRDDGGPARASDEFGPPERLLVLINAPARGDDPRAGLDDALPRLTHDTFDWLERHGLEIEGVATTTSTPGDFARLFPATGGALYGTATHSMTAPFRRPQARTRIAGLYLAGGGAHPGAGVPMVCLSGRIAGRAALADRSGSRR
ncbi:1-hydroxycarotenoid 3,4-desaturase CrtD [Nannocystaceae bacterium ST9]